MEIRLKPETESRLNEMASKSGRPTDELVEDAMVGYLAEVAEVHSILDSRYDEIKSGRVRPIDGEAFFESGPSLPLPSFVRALWASRRVNPPAPRLRRAGRGRSSGWRDFWV